MAEKVPILVVLGIDIDGKPHASRFAEHDAPFVVRAAELMGFHVIRVLSENAKLHTLAEGLPLGKIFATGRAFVPFVNRSAFDKLAVLVEGGVTIEARAAPTKGILSFAICRQQPARSVPAVGRLFVLDRGYSRSAGVCACALTCEFVADQSAPGWRSAMLRRDAWKGFSAGSSFQRRVRSWPLTPTTTLSHQPGP